MPQCQMHNSFLLGGVFDYSNTFFFYSYHDIHLPVNKVESAPYCRKQFSSELPLKISVCLFPRQGPLISPSNFIHHHRAQAADSLSVSEIIQVGLSRTEGAPSASCSIVAIVSLCLLLINKSYLLEIASTTGLLWSTQQFLVKPQLHS